MKGQPSTMSALDKETFAEESKEALAKAEKPEVSGESGGAEPLTCYDCQKTLQASKALLLEPFALPWQGNPHKVVCRQCSPGHAAFTSPEDDAPLQPIPAEGPAPDDQTWKRFCRHSWEVHRQVRTKTLHRARTVRFEEWMDVLQKKYPGVTFTVLRLRLKEAAQLMLQSVATLAETSPEVKAAAKEAFVTWDQTFERMSVDPLFIPNRVMPHILDYCDAIIQGVSEFYLCRKIGCQNVAISSHWLANNENLSVAGRFRCPACGTLYRPWVSKSDDVPFNRVLVLYNPDDNEAQIWPVIWSDTNTSDLKDRLKVLQPEITAALQSGDSVLEKFAEYSKCGSGQRCMMNTGIVSRLAMQHVDRLGKDTWHVKHLWDERAQNYLYTSFRMNWKIGDTVLSQDDQICLWAIARAAIFTKLSPKM